MDDQPAWRWQARRSERFYQRAFYDWRVVGCWWLVVGCAGSHSTTDNSPPTTRQRSIQFCEFLTHERHQGFYGLCAEIETAAGGGEQFRQRPRTAQCQCAFVLGQRFGLVAPGVGPDLQSAELSDAVFDVVKGMQKDVQLAMPETGPGALAAPPVHVAAEAIN